MRAQQFSVLQRQQNIGRRFGWLHKYYCSSGCLSVLSKEEGKNQESIQPSTTPDPGRIFVAVSDNVYVIMYMIYLNLNLQVPVWDCYIFLQLSQLDTTLGKSELLPPE